MALGAIPFTIPFFVYRNRNSYFLADESMLNEKTILFPILLRLKWDYEYTLIWKWMCQLSH